MNRRERPPNHFDPLDGVSVQGREIEGAASVVCGIVHADPVDHHDGLIRIESAQVQRSAASATTRLVDMQACDVAKYIRNFEIETTVDLGPTNDIDRRR